MKLKDTFFLERKLWQTSTAYYKAVTSLCQQRSYLVSRLQARQAERTSAQIWPRRHLPAHSRDLHSVHPVSATPCRRMGLGNLHFCMAVSYCRIHISLQKTERTQQSRDDLFCRDGLCHPGGSQTTNGLPVRHRSLSRLLVASRRRSFVYHGSRVLLVAKTLYARRFPPVLSRRKHRPYHSHLVDSLANPIRFFSPKVSRFGKLSVSGRKKSSPKILVKTRTTYCFNCYLCSRFQY